MSGTLLFLNVSAYVLRNRIATVVDQTQFLAQTAALESSGRRRRGDVADTLARRQAAAVRRYPLVSYAFVPAQPAATRARIDGRCPPASPGRGRICRRRRRCPTG